ncbi:MAG TPA: AI-2E family transporter, partial [Smithellaceae bacterium]|nr:AI-2E family transporter [Smithellaceae bacterium]
MSRAPFASFQNVIFFAFLTIVTVFLGYLLKPFFFAIFWAVLIAAIFAPLNRRLTLRFKRPNLSAGLTLASVLVAMILPLGLLVSLLVAEAIDIYASVHASTDDWVAKIQDIVASLGSHPLLAELQINEAFIAEKSIEVLKAGSDFLVRNLTALTSNT